MPTHALLRSALSVVFGLGLGAGSLLAQTDRPDPQLELLRWEWLYQQVPLPWTSSNKYTDKLRRIHVDFSAHAAVAEDSLPFV